MKTAWNIKYKVFNYTLSTGGTFNRMNCGLDEFFLVQEHLDTVQEVEHSCEVLVKCIFSPHFRFL